jgi:hypothetical protein
MKKVILALGVLFLFAACKKDVPEKQLIVNVTPEVGGSVTPSTGTYAMGSTVKLTATPSSEYIFKEWTGGFTGTTNPSNIVMDADKTITAVFEKREYPLSLTIVGSGTVKEEIIKIASSATNYKSGTTIRLTPQPSAGFQFKKWSGDDTTSKSPLDIVVSKPINLTCTFEKMAITSLKVENLLDTLIISKKHKYIIKGVYSNGATIDLSDSIKITSSTSGINILTDRNLIGAQSGNMVISLTYNNLLIKDTAYVSEIENVDLKTLPFLTTPSNTNARIIVPVVVINYYPTLNGIDIDTKRAPGLGTASPIKIQDLKNRTIDYLVLTKYGLEEGSKFRGYNIPTQTSNVSFKIVKYVNVYELKRGLKDKQDVYLSAQDKLTPVYQPDYFDVFNKINLQSLVENNGVKEVWFSLRPISSEYPVVKDSLTNGITAANFLNLPESNMSSPTGDVSNSYKISNDLPIYDKTYVVYGYNIETSPANNIHNRGHQIEAQLQSVDNGIFGENTATFLNKFVGITIGKNNNKPIGRAGMTHFPPNTTKDYDYDNKSLVESDIEEWKPSGGTKKLINSDRWLNTSLQNYPSLISTKYDYNKDPQYKWLIFWMQSIPGYNNGITGVNDWWDLFYNWDDAVKNKSKLNN